mgnify:CR=1 FL=1
MEQRAREKAAAEPERRNYQHILPEMNMSATHYKDMLTIHEEEYTRDWYQVLAIGQIRRASSGSTSEGYACALAPQI